MRDLKTREGCDALVDASGSADYEKVFLAIAIAQLIAKVGDEVFLRLPTGAKRKAVEILPQPFEVKAALIAKLD